jgi:hypothetical protein
MDVAASYSVAHELESSALKVFFVPEITFASRGCFSTFTEATANPFCSNELATAPGSGVYA